MTNRNYIVVTVAVLMVLIACLAFLTANFSVLQYVNPAAVFAAIAVAVAGIVWFKKAMKS